MGTLTNEDYLNESNQVKVFTSSVRQAFTLPIPIDDAIVSLRQEPWDTLRDKLSFTRYCWLDFKRLYQVALSGQRQARCEIKQRNNAAMYMEALVRNMPITIWSSYDSKESHIYSQS
jgi:hypothetical protein